MKKKKTVFLTYFKWVAMGYEKMKRSLWTKIE